MSAAPSIDVPASEAPTSAGPSRGFAHVPALDGLRALAVMATIAFHISIASHVEAVWLTGGWLGVSTFFTLSGFLITSLLLAEREHTGRVSLADFWSRRAKRLLPALDVFLLVTMALAVTKLVPPQPNLGRAVIFAQLYAKNLLDLHGHGLEPQIPAHLWSLSIEEQFYLLFPLLFIAARRVGRWWPGAVLFSGLAVTSFLVGRNYDLHKRVYDTYTSIQGRAVELLVGVALAFLLAHPVWQRVRTTRWATVAAQAVGVAGCAWLAWLWHDSIVFMPMIHRFIARNALATAAIIVGATTVGPVSALLSVRPLRWVGKVSYGAYLYHSPLFWVMSAERLHVRNAAVLVLVRVSALAVVCELSLRFVENPIRRWRPASRWHVIPALGVPAVVIGVLALVLPFRTL